MLVCLYHTGIQNAYQPQEYDNDIVWPSLRMQVFFYACTGRSRLCRKGLFPPENVFVF